MATATIPNFGLVEVTGFVYVGSLPMGFLWTDEQATPTGDGNGACVVSSPRGHVRIKVGDLVSRREDGSLFSTSSASTGGESE